MCKQFAYEIIFHHRKEILDLAFTFLTCLDPSLCLYRLHIPVSNFILTWKAEINFSKPTTTFWEQQKYVINFSLYFVLRREFKSTFILTLLLKRRLDLEMCFLSPLLFEQESSNNPYLRQEKTCNLSETHKFTFCVTVSPCFISKRVAVLPKGSSFS